MNTLTQVIQRRQMLSPLRIHDLQHNRPLKTRPRFSANSRDLERVGRLRRFKHFLENVFFGNALGFANKVFEGHVDLPIGFECHLQRINIPLLFDRTFGHMARNEVAEGSITQVFDGFCNGLCFEHFITLCVKDFALIIGHIVILKQLLAHVKVTAFYLALRCFDRARHHTRLDWLAFRQLKTIHDGTHPIARKNSHQRVFE